MPQFNPHDPFGEGYNSPAPMGEEIERHVADFAALGMNAHATVAMWLGKPNRFTSVVMTSALEVLEYVRAELDMTKSIQAQVKAAASEPVAQDTGTHALGAGTGDAAPGAGTVVNPAPARDPGARTARAMQRDAIAAANQDWRDAVRQRSEAIRQWDAYVANKRAIYTQLKTMKV